MEELEIRLTELQKREEAELLASWPPAKTIEDAAALLQRLGAYYRSIYAFSRFPRYYYWQARICMGICQSDYVH